MNTESNTTFLSLGVSQALNDALVKRKITTPTPIQSKCIPIALKGKDIIGIAQTGTGKTFAFGLPVIEHIISQKKSALILLPTRELAQQVIEELQPFIPNNIQSVLLIGGAPMYKQIKQLKRNPQLVIGTPGRINDLINKKHYNPSKTSLLILDEADRMLDIGFMPQLLNIFELLPKERQTLLFSATMSKDILDLSNKYMINQEKIEVTPQGTSAQHISQQGLVISALKKHDALENFINEKQEKTIVFIRTKHKARKTTQRLRQAGIKATDMHANKSLAQRKRSLSDFKSGKCDVMIATDIAARGIHVDDIKHVINFDLPDSLEDYVHRIGRTGRAGSTGNALTFIEPDQHQKLKKIERIINKKLPLLEESEEFIKTETKSRSNNRRHRGKRKRYNKRYSKA